MTDTRLVYDAYGRPRPVKGSDLYLYGLAADGKDSASTRMTHDLTLAELNAGLVSAIPLTGTPAADEIIVPSRICIRHTPGAAWHPAGYNLYFGFVADDGSLYGNIYGSVSSVQAWDFYGDGILYVNGTTAMADLDPALALGRPIGIVPGDIPGWVVTSLTVGTDEGISSDGDPFVIRSGADGVAIITGTVDVSGGNITAINIDTAIPWVSAGVGANIPMYASTAGNAALLGYADVAAATASDGSDCLDNWSVWIEYETIVP